MGRITQKEKVKLFHTIARHLGYGRGLRSNAHLYTGGTINTFSYSGNSMWTFTININAEDEFVGVEVNTKYFDVTNEVRKMNSMASFSSPISLEKAAEILSNKVLEY